MRTLLLPADYLCQGLQTNLRKTLDTTHHRSRQNGAGTGSGSRCYTGADLSGVNRGMEKAATPGSVAAGISVTILFFSEF